MSAWKRPLLVAAAAALATAVAGALVTDLGPWYQSLRKPSFQPPDWLFGPAWTLIFALAALSASTAWRGAKTAQMRRAIVTLFSLNMALNVAWSLLFFRMRRPDWAVIEVGFLWASVAALIWTLRGRSRPASALLVPYLAWVSFAAILNLATVQLNGPFGR